MVYDVILIGAGSSKQIRETAQQTYFEPPVGLCYLASFLKIHGYRVNIIDLATEDYSRRSFRSRLKELSDCPLAVGISFYTEQMKEAIELARICREVFPTTALIAGGPHVTFQPEEILTEAPVDFVVRREGESTLVELLEHLRHPGAYPLDQIKSIVYRNDAGTLVSNTERPFITSLDTLPFPGYEMLAAHWRTPGQYLAISGSRGCPGECIYCASRALSGRRYRFHSAEWLFSFLYEYRLRHQIPSFSLLDDTFTVDRRRARELCRLIRECWPGPGLPYWSCRSRADCVVDEICDEVSRAGCGQIHIGIESGDQGVLSQIGKRVSLEKMIKAIVCGRKYDLNVDCSFIIGHHCDTPETIEKTVMLAKAIEAAGIGFSIIGVSTPFPGTRLFEQASKLGIDIVVRNWSKYDLFSPIYRTAAFSFNDLRRAYAAYKDQTISWSDPIGLTDLDHREFKETIRQLFSSLGFDPQASAVKERFRLPKHFDDQHLLQLRGNPVEKRFKNGTATLIMTEVPDWLRISDAGMWVVDRLRSRPSTAEQIISTAAEHFELPRSAVAAPIEEALAALIDREVIEMSGHPAEESPDTMPMLARQPLEQISLQLVSHCNLSCPYCYCTLEDQGALPFDMAAELFEEAAVQGVRQISFTGGEPMLHPRVRDLLTACRSVSEKLTIKLVSNGTAASPEVYDEVYELVDELILSLDGTDEATNDLIRGPGSYAKLAATLKRLGMRSGHSRIAIAFTPQPANIAQIPSLLTTALKLGASRVLMNQPRLPAYYGAQCEYGFLDHEDYCQSIEHFEEILRQMFKLSKNKSNPIVDMSYALVWPLTAQLLAKTCGGGVVTLSLDPRGAAFPCSALTGREGCSLGVFPRQSLAEIIAAGREWSERVFSVDRDERCRDCEYRYFCGGGCRALGETLSSRDSRCELIQEQLDGYLGTTFLKPRAKSKADKQKQTATRPREDYVQGFRCP